IANNVIDKLNSMKDENTSEKANIRGHALFLRSFCFHQLAQVFCKQYTSNANSDLGLPLRLSSDLEESTERSTLFDTYQKILNDLKEAEEIIYRNQVIVNLPSRVSCYGLLARVYLSMKDYENAEHYASLYLNEKKELLDFNNLSISANPSIPIGINPEVSFYAYSENILPRNTTPIDTILYNSYHPDD